MAQKVDVKLIDDLDGSSADATVSFGLDGKDYEIDLSDANASKLRDALAAYVASGRRDGGERKQRSAKASPARIAVDREQNQAIRSWARTHGFKVSVKGRIRAEVLEAYHNKTSLGLSRQREVSGAP